MWIGAETIYSREEVAQIVEDIMTIALEEMERTSRETARDVAAEEAGKTAYYKTLAEKERQTIRSLEQEIKVLQRRTWLLGGTSIALGGLAGISGGIWYFNR